MPAAAARLVAVDWLRGLVMALMALDHVDHATNPDHVQRDGALFGPGGPLSAPDFTVRWLTHLCAPTFVLLAGTSVALSAAAARARGATEREIDRHLVLRGLVIVGLEVTLVSHYWRVAEGQAGGLLPIYFQVLWAIGGGLVLAAALRHLATPWLLGGAAALLVAAELIRTATLDAPWSQPFWLALTFTLGIWSGATPSPAGFDLICVYPLLAWLPALLLGLALGRRLVAGRLTPRFLAVTGLAALGVFLVLRGVDGFGNMGLYRRDGSLLEWLHCSKYPPSITFFALELGLGLLVLAGLSRIERVIARLPGWNPLGVFGRVPMFFYLLHLPVIGLLVAVGPLPGRGEGSALASVSGTLAVLLVCWPLCALYGWYKARWRHGWTRFV